MAEWDEMWDDLNQLEEKIDGLSNYQKTVNDLMESRLDTFERQMAMIVQGYSELAANVEAILSVLASDTSEARLELQAALMQSKMQMMEVLKKSGQIMTDELDGQPPV